MLCRGCGEKEVFLRYRLCTECEATDVPPKYKCPDCESCMIDTGKEVFCYHCYRKKHEKPCRKCGKLTTCDDPCPHCDDVLISRRVW